MSSTPFASVSASPGLNASTVGSGPTLVPQSFQAEVTLKVGYHYLFGLPDGYNNDESKQWPLLVFLHGGVERGEDLELLKRHGPPKLMASGWKFEAIVACPQVPARSIWNPHGVMALVNTLKKQYRVDDDRVYLTGLSIGGLATWETACEYPDVFAATLPICGRTNAVIFLADRIKDLPVWIFHGEADSIVPADCSTRMHHALTRAGGNPVLTIYPGVEHDAWTRTYENPEVWKWLFDQRRQSRGA